uniref:Ig-like domain-containing protein n=1 Tax=Bos indicus x Bos taurus TaxID=30522 RepID=A0A4W2FS97_BOBOX
MYFCPLSTGVHAQPGASVKVSCKASGYTFTDYMHWVWIHQAPAKGLEWMGSIYYNGDTYHSPSFKSHTSISRGTSKNQSSLQLSSVTTVDTAVCYCARDTVRGRQFDSFPLEKHPVCSPHAQASVFKHSLLQANFK